MKRAFALIVARIISIPILLLWRLAGWGVDEDLPELDKYILVAAPHTSNWDYVMMIALSAYHKRKPYTFVKDSAFKLFLVGTLVRWFGGIPIDRSKSQNLVEQAVEFIDQKDRIVLVITPEGTRNKSAYWRSGFYHIALKAKVPYVLGYLDYKRKRGSGGLVIHPSGDVDADLQIIREFYATHGHGKYPENFTPAYFRPDDNTSSK